MKLSTECLEASQVDSLLQGNLTPEEYESAQNHLELCETCRARVEATIGPEQWWSDVQSVLLNSRTGAFSQRNAFSTDAEPNEPSTAKLLDLLGPTDDPNMLGRIGPYEIIGLLGQGGMGAVFKGFDRSLNRFVAIKMLLPHLAASGAARKRFAREGQAVAAVVDDHVMAIHCVDEWQGVPYLVMTYSRGVSLQKRLSDNGPLEVREILRIGVQAAKGLAAAHAQGIVHRDIKPANIFLDQSVERVQLMDFGLARAVDDASLTRSGTLAGTPQYMSPEQARAETVDHCSDLFSLGSVMYAMCTGHAPFRAESSYSVLRLITDKEPRPIREINPEIPAWLCAIISKLMAKQVNDRFASAQEVAKLLEDCLAHVQQPTIAALPDGLVDRSVPGSFSFRSRTIGVFAMFAAVCSIIVAMLLMQTPDKPSPNGDPPSPTNIVDRVDSGQSTHLMKPVTKENSEYRVTLLGITREVSAEFTESEKLPGESQPVAWMRAIAMIERLDNVDGPYGFEAQVTDGLKQTRKLKIRSTSELDLNSRDLASKISPIAVPKVSTSARGKIYMFTIYGEFQASDIATLRFQFGRPGQQELVFEDVKIPSIEKEANPNSIGLLPLTSGEVVVQNANVSAPPAGDAAKAAPAESPLLVEARKALQACQNSLSWKQKVDMRVTNSYVHSQVGKVTIESRVRRDAPRMVESSLQTFDDQPKDHIRLDNWRLDDGEMFLGRTTTVGQKKLTGLMTIKGRQKASWRMLESSSSFAMEGHFPGNQGRTLMELLMESKEPDVRIEKIGDHDCLRISGRNDWGTMTVWIEAGPSRRLRQCESLKERGNRFADGRVGEDKDTADLESFSYFVEDIQYKVVDGMEIAVSCRVRSTSIPNGGVKQEISTVYKRTEIHLRPDFAIDNPFVGDFDNGARINDGDAFDRDAAFRWQDGKLITLPNPKKSISDESKVPTNLQR